MPEISRFYGIIIRMFFSDHSPPHFHATYSEYSAQININNGELPRRALRLVQDWTELHRDELTNGYPTISWDGLALIRELDGSITPCPLDFSPETLYQQSTLQNN